MNPLATLALIVCLPLQGPVVLPVGGGGQVKVLYYSKNVMDRVFLNHTKPSRPGDYQLGMYRRPDADCLTAVNYNSRWMLGANVVLVVDLWDPVQKQYERHRCQASDHQMRRHSTKAQRLEVDYRTAKSVNMLRRGTTWARIVGYE